jgi:exodeoxyribonuclease VIII
MRYQKHFMLDLETWGTSPYSAIVSIGLVHFDPNVQDVDTTLTTNAEDNMRRGNFEVHVDPLSNEKAGFKIEAGTISWWLNQARNEARTAWLSALKFSISDALLGVSIWMDELDKLDPPDIPSQADLEQMSEEAAYRATIKHRIVWGNGSNFDNELMKQAFKVMNMRCPWDYSGDRCFRTIKNLPRAEAPGIRPANNIHHTALGDALYQARWLQNIVNEYSLTL